jgi:hypothetical protein
LYPDYSTAVPADLNKLFDGRPNFEIPSGRNYCGFRAGDWLEHGYEWALLELDAHRFNEHGDEDWPICSVCGQSFDAHYRTDLTRHLLLQTDIIEEEPG